MALAIPTLVLRRALEKQMIWMNVDLDRPTRVRYGKVDANHFPVGKSKPRQLRHHGQSAGTQCIAEDQLRVRFRRRTVTAVHQCSDESKRPGTPGVAQAP